MSANRQQQFIITLSAFIGVLLLALLIADIGVTVMQREVLRGEARHHAESELNLVAIFTREAFLRHDYALVEEFLNNWGGEHETVVSIRAVAANGFVIADFQRPEHKGYALTVEESVSVGSDRSVILKLTKNLEHLDEIIAEMALRLVAGSLLVTLLAGTALWQTMRKTALQPMQREIDSRRQAENQLQQAKDELEQRVQERTAELNDANRALARSEHRYRSLVDNLPQSVFLKDRNLVYMSCNRAFAERLGIESSQIGGHTDFDFHPQALAERYRADDRRIMADGVTDSLVEPYQQGERELTVQTVKTPVRNETGDIVGILGIFWDVTEQQANQRELARIRTELEQRVAERTEQLQKTVNLMAGREVRMAELKEIIQSLTEQLEKAGLTPNAQDPLAKTKDHEQA